MLSLEFKDNNTGHDDIILTIGEREIVGDAYYFALDRGVLPEQEDAEKIRIVLKVLLKQWLAAIPSEESDMVVYLPFGFFDQCTYWLKCHFKESNVLVYSGWSNVEGYSFFPSEISKYLPLVSDFEADGPPIELSKVEFYAAINESLSKAA
jgi:hypothetical protein